MASIQVNGTGLPTASWRSCICSPIVVALSMELAVGVVSFNFMVMKPSLQSLPTDNNDVYNPGITYPFLAFMGRL
eukprot:6374221-Ditylum_brightwellii.AAC.1